MVMADIDPNRKNKVPRPLSDGEKARLEEFIESIHYSARLAHIPTGLPARVTDRLVRYSDDQFEYRHVQLPKNMLKAIPKDYHDPQKGTLKLLWEEEWRALGITQVFPVQSSI